MKFAIIDISSSSISLLAAEGEKTFDILFRERENVSILHYMEGKNLSERGVEKIAENLEKMKEICRKAGIDKCYVISTASMRNFENFEWVIEELYKRVAVRVNLLDGQEEAYCDLVSNERYRALDRAVLADIGGGSIELCDLTKDNPDSLVYLDFGPIQINHRFVANIHPTEGEAKDIKKYVRKKLEKSGLGAYMDGVFISDEIGTEKPGIGFFTPVFAALQGIEKKDVLIVGDSLTSDMRGGNNAGFCCCWYNPNRLKNETDVRVDCEIHSLNEIEAVLRGFSLCESDSQVRFVNAV